VGEGNMKRGKRERVKCVGRRKDEGKSKLKGFKNLKNLSG
jgi:hypothetical protein